MRLWAVVVLALAAPSTVHAGEAEVLLRKGIAQYAQANFKRSTKLLKRALELAPRGELGARVLLYLGCNQVDRGKAEDARRSFGLALAQHPSLTVADGDFKPPIVTLFRQVAAATVGYLTLTSTPAGAVVRLGDRELGRTPLVRVPLGAGEHRLEVVGQGAAPLIRRATITPGKELRVNVKLARPKPAPPPRPAPVKPRPRRGLRTAAGYTVLGTGLAAVATMAVLYGVGVTGGDEAHEAYMTSTTEAEFAQHRGDVQDARRLVVTAHVLAGVAAVGLGLGVYLLSTRRGARREGAAALPRVGVALSGHGVGLRLGGQF